ncbi:hypothetical protein TNCV_4045301 [Trichonephila clavipes]|nr:hypothetical protein TNCV_4045301 [Trichonephila clavipes]
MFDSSSYDNPTPLAHADTSRDVLPRGGTSQDSSLKTFRDVKIHGSKLRLLVCRRSSNYNDLLPNMKTQRSAMSLKRLLPDTGLSARINSQRLVNVVHSFCFLCGLLLPKGRWSF